MTLSELDTEGSGLGQEGLSVAVVGQRSEEGLASGKNVSALPLLAREAMKCLASGKKVSALPWLAREAKKFGPRARRSQRSRGWPEKRRRRRAF